MSVMQSVRRTTSDVLGTVSDTAHGASSGVRSITNLIEAGELVSRSYRDNVEKQIKTDAVKKHNRKIRELALDDARFYKQLNTDLQGDEELKSLYEAALSDYNQDTNVQSIAAE